MCGTAESGNPQQGKHPCNRETYRQHKGNASQCGSYNHLHDTNPVPLSAKKVYDGTPKRFYDPWQIEPCNEKRAVGIVYAHAFEHA